MLTEKRCSQCGVIKQAAEFYPRNNRPGGLQSKCANCHKAAYCDPKYHKKNYREPYARGYRLFSLAKERAERKGLEITINPKWVAERIRTGLCEVTWLPFRLDEGLNAYSPSLDRVDSKSGYTPDNTRVVCFMFNSAKGTATDEDVRVMARALLEA